MLVSSITSVLALVAAATATIIKYDNNYNQTPGTSLTIFACSDGANGLITKTGAKTVGELQAKLKPNVRIAAVADVKGWNSPSCGTCYRATNKKNGKILDFVGIDVSSAPGVGLIAGADAFSYLSPSGTTDEGNINVVISLPGQSACFN